MPLLRLLPPSTLPHVNLGTDHASVSTVSNRGKLLPQIYKVSSILLSTTSNSNEPNFDWTNHSEALDCFVRVCGTWMRRGLPVLPRHCYTTPIYAFHNYLESHRKQVHDKIRFDYKARNKIMLTYATLPRSCYLWRPRRCTRGQDMYVTMMKNQFRVFLQIYKVARDQLIGLNEINEPKLTLSILRI